MQLLVSVANASEARHALDGGADLIDAKDPLTGALGAVTFDTLRQIHDVVAGRRAVTAALGDACDEETIERLAFEYAASGVAFVKVGFAGVTERSRVERLVAAAGTGVKRARHRTCGVVAVAYADTGGATSVDRDMLVNAAAREGATGVLLDTALKLGPGLRDLMSAAAIETWVARAHQAGLMAALAGKLTAGDLAFVRDAGADIAGVRGAACERGRASSIVEERVRQLRRALEPVLATADRSGLADSGARVRDEAVLGGNLTVAGRSMATRMLPLRALLAFLALPGCVAFLVPALIVPSTQAHALHVEGLVPFVAGVVVLLWCVGDFYRAGKGTLAPWDPPRHLVRIGLYRYSRNPMYVGVLLILIGWAAGFRTPALITYTIAMAIAFHLRVVLHEEPWLARTFPGEWQAYRSQVPRWVLGQF